MFNIVKLKFIVGVALFFLGILIIAKSQTNSGIAENSVVLLFILDIDKIVWEALLDPKQNAIH